MLTDREKSLRRINYLNNREHYLCLRKKYYQENKAKIALYYREKHKTDIKYRLARNLRNRMNMALKRGSRDGSAVKDLGCSISEFKFYIEGMFKAGMNWDNWGEWHLDHIIALSLFNLSDREQFLKAVHYSNLQPLWAKENLQKGKKLINSRVMS